ncbi:hypothetical protein MRX96_040261 [Rhipicephalus microplus]
MRPSEDFQRLSEERNTQLQCKFHGRHSSFARTFIYVAGNGINSRSGIFAFHISCGRPQLWLGFGFPFREVVTGFGTDSGSTATRLRESNPDRSQLPLTRQATDAQRRRGMLRLRVVAR